MIKQKKIFGIVLLLLFLISSMCSAEIRTENPQEGESFIATANNFQLFLITDTVHFSEKRNGIFYTVKYRYNDGFVDIQRKFRDSDNNEAVLYRIVYSPAGCMIVNNKTPMQNAIADAKDFKKLFGDVDNSLTRKLDAEIKKNAEINKHVDIIDKEE